MIITNAKVLTMEETREVYEEVDVRITDGKISEIGPALKPENQEKILDAKGQILMPGFIDAHCHLGMWEDALGFEGNDGNEDTDPITPEMRGIDAINPMDRNFSEAVKGGVLTVCTGPGSANAMGGTFAIIKTHGQRIDDMILRAPAAMKIAFGENPKRIYGKKNKAPATRMATMALLRSTLLEAKEYYEAKKSEDVSKHPKVNLKMEELIPVFEKKIPLKAHAHRADDIFSAIRLAKEFDLLLTLDHVTEGHLIAEDLKKENISCIVGPSFGERSKVELKNKSFTTPGILAKAGLTVAIMTDAPVIPIEHLNMTASYSVKEGMDHYDALRALTICPAKILNIEEELGSIKVGKRATLVLWDQDPLTIAASVSYSILDGEIIYAKSDN